MTALTTADVVRLETLDAPALIAWAVERFGAQLAVASSFGLEDVALIDLAANATSGRLRVFTLDTGRLNQETYDVMDRVRSRYDLDLQVLFPDRADVEPLVREHGVNPFYESIELRKACCHARKVRPLERALAGVPAWMTGLRREQSVTRVALSKAELEAGGRLKLAPLADWSWDDVWRHVRENRVPYNALHDQGYPSIGCQPCTRAIRASEDLRAGRWWWENPETKECGLHVRPRTGG